MKVRAFWKFGLVLALLLLPAIGGWLQRVSSVSQITTEASAAESESTVAAQAVPEEEDGTVAEEAPGSDVSEAPVQPITMEKQFPPSVNPSGPVSEVIRLSNSGSDESVMLAFVTNSAARFNLGADTIIYLKDIGVPDHVVTAMLARDEQLPPENFKAELQPPQAPAEAPNPPAYEAVPAPSEQVATESTGAAPAEAAPAEFYDSLAPYGSWYDVAGYGTCWQPSVVVINSTWRPYFDCGHWVYSDCGWYWASDYSWGWAPFHYGRWFQHRRLGWCWRPDRVWGPSWVSWRYNADYCGWAPLPPAARFTVGIGLSGHTRHVRGLSASSFPFVHWSHFGDRHLTRYAASRHEGDRIFSQTTAVTGIAASRGTVVNRGITPGRVAAATRTPVQVVSLRDVNTASAHGHRTERAGTGDRVLNVFRPVRPQTAGMPATQPGRPQAGGASPAQPVRQRSDTGRSAAPATATAAAPSSTAPGWSRVIGRTPSAQPGTTDHSRLSPSAAAPAGKPSDPVAPSPRSTASRAINPVTTPGNTTVQSQRRQAAPLVLRGPDRTPRANQEQEWSAQIPRSESLAGRTPGAQAAPRAPVYAAPHRSELPDHGQRQAQVPRAEAPKPAPEVARMPVPWTAPAARGQSFQPAPRSAPVEVPRYAPAQSPRMAAPPAPAPQRAYSAPDRSPSRSESRELRSGPGNPAWSSAPSWSPSPSSSSPSSGSSSSGRSSSGSGSSSRSSGRGR